MKKIVYSEEAVKNLKAIYDHTAEHFEKNLARSVIEALFEKIELLGTHPNLGKTSTLTELAREFIVEGNVVYYQVTEETIDIITIKPRKTKK